MSQCHECKNWITKRLRAYEDAQVVVLYEARPGHGRCEILEIETKPEFGCNQFAAGDNHVYTLQMNGKCWEHWRMDRCPDCEGRGSGLTGGVCGRCQGTGNVRHYDDGYVGEERTRRHPNEPTMTASVDPGTVLAPLPKADVL